MSVEVENGMLLTGNKAQRSELPQAGSRHAGKKHPVLGPVYDAQLWCKE